MSTETTQQEVNDKQTIWEAMSRVMADIGAVGKGDRNDQQGYSFRGIDRVMNAVHGAMVKHGVTVTPQVLDKEYGSYKTKNGAEMRVAVMTVRYTFYGPAGDSVEVVTIGEASDSADKATNKALSAAMKYALLHTFVVPTEDIVKEDADRSSPERGEQTVDLAKYITEQLNQAERAALRDAWKADFDFTTRAIPFDRETECRTLIDSYVGTIPDEAPAASPEPKPEQPAPSEPKPQRSEGAGVEPAADGSAPNISAAVDMLDQDGRKKLQAKMQDAGFPPIDQLSAAAARQVVEWVKEIRA
jgi:hypothetical protein